MKKWNYAQAGVDRVQADHLIETISGPLKKTWSAEVVSNVGGYASLYRINSEQYIAATTDGVGTKLKLAFELNQHSTVGIDLVAMSVNDLLCVGSRPLFFLDYFATGKLQSNTASKVIQGIAQGCSMAECALVGGETAEMPGFYRPGEYDLAGFAVGLVRHSAVLPKKVKSGDVLIGLSSSGFHSNGYSLVRKWLDTTKGPRRKTLQKKFLVPTAIYVKAIAPLLQEGKILGLAHITGSGFLNIPRISDQVSYRIRMPSTNDLPECYRWARSFSMEARELYRTFNMGIGMIMVVSPEHESSVLKYFKKSSHAAWSLGEVVKKKTECEITVEEKVQSRWSSISLSYARD